MSVFFYLLFPLAMAGIAKLFPYKKPDNFVPPGPEAMEKIMKWGKISGWYLLTAVAVLLYLIGVKLCELKQQFIPHDSGIIYKVLPDNMYWFMIGFIFILGINYYIFILMSKLYLADDFHGYIEYSNSRSKYNASEVIKPIAAFFTGLGLLLLFCLWNYSIYIYNDKMVIRWFLSTKNKVYGYNQVKSVNYMKKNGKYGPHCDVIFKDGEDWDTSAGLPDDEKDEMIKYISRQSGVKIDTLDDNP
jgi:hypothetical protein